MKEITVIDNPIALKGLDLSPNSASQDDRLILALHGWKDNAASYIPMAQHLQNTRLVALDFAGHGLSDHRPANEDYGIWHYVDDVVQVIEQLGMSKVTLMGHSLGAAVSVMVAHCVPDKIEQLFLMDGLCPMASKPSHAPGILADYIAARRQQQTSSKKTRYFSSLRAAVEARTQSHFPVSKPSAEGLVKRAMVEDAEGWRWRTDPRVGLPSPIRFTPEQALAFPASLTVDTHVFYSDRGMIASMIHKYREQLSHLKFHAFTGGHHFHMDDEPAEVAKKVEDLLTGM